MNAKNAVMIYTIPLSMILIPERNKSNTFEIPDGSRFTAGDSVSLRMVLMFTGSPRISSF
ncbi:MAG: hypothetical protein FNNCIFGK_01493 [Bacteroidia bacterium]|nr:hypothetical protein [Bacteroidia bacterium]